jgi:hypothetical protein
VPHIYIVDKNGSIRIIHYGALSDCRVVYGI